MDTPAAVGDELCPVASSRSDSWSWRLRLAAHIALRMAHHDKRRTVTVILGVAFSYFLMVFQGGLFVGFLEAAGIVIRVSGASFWVTPAAVPCFEFGAPMRDAVSLELLGIRGVLQAARVVEGFAQWLGPNGERRSVTVVGMESLEGGRVPMMLPQQAGHERAPDSAWVDRSALENLGLGTLPTDVEINRHRATVIQSGEGFASFLGAPYAFLGYDDARKMLQVEASRTMLVAVRASPGADIARVMTEVRARYPELQVLSTTEFARQSGIYWMTQTGAGGAIGLAGILGMLVGALIISQMLYAATVDRLDEFATLYAVGAHASLPRQIVAVQSVSSAAAGSLLGAVALWPLVMAAKRFVVAWITIPWWLPMGCLGLTLAVAIAASRASLRLIRGVDPVRVFRT